MRAEHFDIVVVGAGIAGLTFACCASRSGKRVLVLERDPVPGGLARSFSCGPYTYDIGPHRFHTDDPEVNAFIFDILGDDHLIIERKSAVWLEGKFLEWPLRLASLLQLDAGTLLAVGLDFFRSSGADGPSFEDYIVRQYGKKLYEIFFKPYTEKFLGIDPSRISRDWAITGIDRAVLDKNIRSNSLADLLKSLFASPPPLSFIYPASGGIGVFAEKLAMKIEAAGGELRLGHAVDGVTLDGGLLKSVAAGGREVTCDSMIWTAPLTDFLRLCGQRESGLEYLSLILYNYAIEGEPLIDYQWCYFGAQSVPFNRISLPTRFNRLLAPPGHSSFCVEVTCRTGDNIWNAAEEKEAAIRASLEALGIIASSSLIRSVWIERIPQAYPIYDLGYQQRKSALVGEGVRNVHLLGRTADFWYNNMDHSIAAALGLFQRLEQDGA